MSLTGRIKQAGKFVAERFHDLIRIHDTPHAISGGVAIGIFFGFVPIFIPFVPLKSALSMGISWIFRCSKTAALIAVTAHDVIFPIWPFVLRLEYEIGYWLLHHHMPPKWKLEVRHMSFERWFSTETYHGRSDWVHERLTWMYFAKILGPTLLGSVIVGIPAGFICYAIALRIVKRYQARLLLQGQTPS